MTTSTPEAQVRVKALEWEELEDNSHRGRSAIGYYHVFPGTGFSYDLCGPVGGRLATYKRLADAKAAAQSDYERRVLSALTPEQGETPPSPETNVWGGPETSPDLYRTVHDAATAVYEASTPADYRYSASALRQAVDAGIRAALAPRATPPSPSPSSPSDDGL